MKNIKRYVKTQFKSENQLINFIEEEFKMAVIDIHGIELVDTDERVYEQDFYDEEGNQYKVRFNYDGYIISITYNK